MAKAKAKAIQGYRFHVQLTGTIELPMDEVNAIIADGIGHGTYDGCNECRYAIERWLEYEVTVDSVLYNAWQTGIDYVSEIESY